MSKAAPHDIGYTAVDDHRRVQQHARIRAIAAHTAHALRKRAQLVPLDGTGRRPDHPEHHRRHQRCVASYVTGKERKREREEERKDKTDRGTERAADEIGARCCPEPIDDVGRGHDRDVGSAEPAQDRAGRREKKNDKDLIGERRDLGDLEQRRPEEEAEHEANECCNEANEAHEGDSFLS